MGIYVYSFISFSIVMGVVYRISLAVCGLIEDEQHQRSEEFGVYEVSNEARKRNLSVNYNFVILHSMCGI